MKKREGRTLKEAIASQFLRRSDGRVGYALAANTDYTSAAHGERTG